MWVFTTIGFFSIVAHRDRRGFVLVRARDKADLSALVQRFPAPRPTVQRTPNADYLFRVVVEKQAMARVLESLTEGIDYENFKDAVAKAQGVSRAKVYHDVWAALLPLQARAARAARPEFKLDDYATEAEATAALRARMGDAQFQRFSCSDGIRVVPSGEAIKTDAGMMPDTRSDDERLAELKARMDPLVFARRVDQAKGEDIVTGSSTDKFETFDEWLARETAALSGTSEDPPLKPVQERDPALGKKT